MSNRRSVSPGFKARTSTIGPQGVTITPPSTTSDTRKFYVGADHAPTEEEALEMGRALFDQIAASQARDARQVED